jgi:hypothetical protein
MKPKVLLVCVAAITALWSSPFSRADEPAAIVSGSAAASELELAGLRIGRDGSIAGTLVNRGDNTIEDVDLLVSHTWSWNDEYHPGEDNPGRASHLRVAGAIPARGSLPFSYAPDPPLIERPDGSFKTTAGVQSFKEVRD